MKIEKCTPVGTVTVVYTGEIVSTLPNGIILKAQWERSDRDLGYTTFATGDRFTEYFYTDQHFNIMQVEAIATGALRGWYCNIAKPANIIGETVSYIDLYLDIWVHANGDIVILDEDEFADATDLTDEDRLVAQQGLAEVIRWAAEGLEPFQRQ